MNMNKLTASLVNKYENLILDATPRQISYLTIM